MFQYNSEFEKKVEPFVCKGSSLFYSNIPFGKNTSILEFILLKRIEKRVNNNEYMLYIGLEYSIIGRVLEKITDSLPKNSSHNIKRLEDGGYCTFVIDNLKIVICTASSMDKVIDLANYSTIFIQNFAGIISRISEKAFNILLKAEKSDHIYSEEMESIQNHNDLLLSFLCNRKKITGFICRMVNFDTEDILMCINMLRIELFPKQIINSPSHFTKNSRLLDSKKK
jgi:hypothetical protein